MPLGEPCKRPQGRNLSALPPPNAKQRTRVKTTPGNCICRCVSRDRIRRGGEYPECGFKWPACSPVSVDGLTRAAVFDISALLGPILLSARDCGLGLCPGQFIGLQPPLWLAASSNRTIPLSINASRGFSGPGPLLAGAGGYTSQRIFLMI